MPDENFELSRRHALPGLSAVSVASAGAGIGTSAYLSDAESVEDNTLAAGELALYVDNDLAADQREAGDETGATVSDNGEATASLDRGEPVTVPGEHRDGVPYASPATVIGPSDILQTNNRLTGIPGFDSSAGRPPRCPEVAGPGRLAHGLPLQVNNVRRQ
jgi:predicted ribosomally synthesized peptide with SipW-like signal peptide